MDKDKLTAIERPTRRVMTMSWDFLAFAFLFILSECFSIDDEKLEARVRSIRRACIMAWGFIILAFLFILFKFFIFA